MIQKQKPKTMSISAHKASANPLRLIIGSPSLIGGTVALNWVRLCDGAKVTVR